MEELENTFPGYLALKKTNHSGHRKVLYLMNKL
jgi:hypothetical protein